MNNREFNTELFDELKEESKSHATEKMRSILKAPVLIKRAAILFYFW